MLPETSDRVCPGSLSRNVRRKSQDLIFQGCRRVVLGPVPIRVNRRTDWARSSLFWSALRFCGFTLDRGGHWMHGLHGDRYGQQIEESYEIQDVHLLDEKSELLL